MQYRYYIGLSIPSPLREVISGIQAQLFDASIVIQPLEPHITLLPPPALLHIPPDKLIPPVQELAKPFLPLELTLRNIETFGNHTIAIRVESQELHTLQYELAGILARWWPQPNPSQHRFHPHVTLNQAIRGKSIPMELIEKYQQKLSADLPARCRIDHLTLYRWQKPRTYTEENL